MLTLLLLIVTACGSDPADVAAADDPVAREGLAEIDIDEPAEPEVVSTKPERIDAADETALASTELEPASADDEKGDAEGDDAEEEDEPASDDGQTPAVNEDDDQDEDEGDPENDAGDDDAPAIDPALAPLVAELEAATTIPLRLPRDLDGGELYATVSLATNDQYVIDIGYAPDCFTGACGFGTVWAKRITADDSALDGSSGGVSFALPNGSEAWFLDSSCGASCGDGSVVWDEDGVRYSFGKRSAGGRDMMTMLWNTVEPDAPFPAPPESCDDLADLGNGLSADVVVRDGFHWLVSCSDLGVQSELVDQDAQVRRIGETDFLALDRADGTSLITVRSFPVLDYSSGADWQYPRLVIATADIRCGTSEDGRDVVGDAERASIFTSLGRLVDIDFADADLAAC